MLIGKSRATNVESTLLNLRASSEAWKGSLEKLSSGSRLSNSWVDAGGLAVSCKLRAAVSRLGQVKLNLGNAKSFLSSQESALRQMGELVTRMQELKVMSLDASKNSTDGANFQVEFRELCRQFRQTSERTFNGIPLFSDADKEGKLVCRSDETGQSSVSITLPPVKVQSVLGAILERRYQIIDGSHPWDEALSDAEQRGGHLATITSPEEWDEVEWQLGGDPRLKNPLWIGLRQSGTLEPDGNWNWVTGEAYGYQKWKLGEPDNGGVTTTASSANGLAFNQSYGGACTVVGHLGDEVLSNADGVVMGFVVEYTLNGERKYEFVKNSPLSWEDARDAAYDAVNRGLVPAGAVDPHLATISGDTEHETMAGSAMSSGIQAGDIMWLGAQQVIPPGVVETEDLHRSYWQWIGETPSASSLPADVFKSSPGPHSGEPNNESAAFSEQKEDFAYLSGSLGDWGDTSGSGVKVGITGYLMEEDMTLSKISLSAIQKALEWVAHYRGQSGAEASRIAFAADLADVASVQLSVADSRISDTDIAFESAKLAANRVLVESGAFMLKTAKDAMGNIMKLIDSVTGQS